MNVKYKLLVDFAWPNKSNVIMVSENDSNSRLCNFTLLFNKEAFDMSDVSSAQVQSVLPNGTIVSDAVDILTDDDGNKINVVEYLIPEEITKISGKATMVIELTGTAGETITSFEFYIASRNALYKEDEVTDEDKSNFAQLLNKINQQINKFEKLMENEALPNPYQISITVDGVTYNYTGANEVVIDMYDVGYINEFDPADAEDPIDETAAAQAIAAATLCEQGIKTNAQVLSEVNTKFSNLDSSIAEAKGYSDSTTEMYNKMKFFIDDTTVATDKVYSSNKVNNLFGSVASIDDEATATTSVWSSQKTQDAIDAKEISVDSALDDDSTNPVQNKIIKSAIDGKADKATTLEGYGITDAATKTSVEAVSAKLSQYEDDGYLPKDGVESLSNVALTTRIANVDVNLKMLGYTLPSNLSALNYIDSNGVFHQNVGRIDLGTLTWETTSPISGKEIYKTSLSTLPPNIKTPTSSDKVANVKCVGYETDSAFNVANQVKNKIIGVHTTGEVRIYDTSYASASALKSGLNGKYLYYELATEKTYSADGNEITSAITSTLQTVTDDIANLNDYVDVTNDFTFSTDCTWNSTWTHLYKDGNYIRGTLGFTTPSSVTSDKAIVTVPTKYKNKATSPMILGALMERWSGTPKGMLAITSGTSSSLQLMQSSWIANTNVIIDVCWRI